MADISEKTKDFFAKAGFNVSNNEELEVHYGPKGESIRGRVIEALYEGHWLILESGAGDNVQRHLLNISSVHHIAPLVKV